MEKKWYTLRIYSGQEAKIKAHIEAEIKLKGIEDKVGRIIIPSETSLSYTQFSEIYFIRGRDRNG